MPVGSVHHEVIQAVARAVEGELGPARTADVFGSMSLNARVPIDEAQMMWAKLTALDDDGTLGTRIGKRQLHSEGVLSLIFFAAGAQSNVVRALRITSRYYALISSHAELEVSMVGEASERRLRVRSIYGAGARTPTVSQATLASLLKAIRSLCAVPVQPTQVHLSAPHSGRVCDRLRKLYGAPVMGGTGEDALYFTAETASAPLANVDPNRARVLEDAAQQALDAMDHPSVFQEEVAKEIQVMLPETPTLHLIAERLGLSHRALQRRLNAESLTFRQLCLHTRLQVARGYLRAGGTVAAAAFLVGYADATTFSRAYRKMMGHAPIRDRATPQ